MKKIVLSAFLGAIILLAWQSFSWMVLPFHNMAYSPIPEGEQVAEVIKDSISDPGVYSYPGMDATEEVMTETMQNGPYIGMLLVYPDGLE